mgnify:CR=1 FL=1|tara:strand:+ start:9484 stop:9873 length:390 start_codon:yes stop_codon:yes gene_type:complete
MFSQLSLNKIIRFSIVGGLSTIINFILFYFLYKSLGINYNISSAIGYSIGMILGYFLNKNWTFYNKVNLHKHYITKYIFSQLLGLLLCQISLFIFVVVFIFNILLANVLSLGLAAILSFILIDLFVFKN